MAPLRRPKEEKELQSPPGRMVWWIIEHKEGRELKPTPAKTAFEAARNLGLTLSECGQITWREGFAGEQFNAKGRQ